VDASFSFHGTMDQKAAERLREVFAAADRRRNFKLTQSNGVVVEGVGEFQPDRIFGVLEWTGAAAVAEVVGQIAHALGDAKVQP
jgi:hypothetical protein